eukprot:gene5773-4124_t
MCVVLVAIISFLFGFVYVFVCLFVLFYYYYYYYHYYFIILYPLSVRRVGKKDVTPRSVRFCVVVIYLFFGVRCTFFFSVEGYFCVSLSMFMRPQASRYACGAFFLSLFTLWWFLAVPYAATSSVEVLFVDASLSVTQGSPAPYFPLNYPAVPRRDKKYPNTDNEDPDELIYLAEYTKLDMLHSPLAFNIGFQLCAGLQLSAFSTSGVLVASHERWALEDYYWHNKTESRSSPTADKLLTWLIASDHLDIPERLQIVNDRYFVEQIGPGTFRDRLCQRFVDLMSIPDMSPLVVDMYNWHLANFMLWCLYYQSHALQTTARRKFVLMGSEGDPPATYSFFVQDVQLRPIINISYLLDHPLLAHWYSVNGNIVHPKFTALPLGYLFFHRAEHTLLPDTPGSRIEENNVHNEYMKLYLQGVFPFKRPESKKTYSLSPPDDCGQNIERMNLSSVQGSLDAVWKHYSRVCRAMRRTLVILVLLLFLNVPPLAQATGGTLPMPDKDLPYPPTLDRSDPEELIYFSQYSRDDLLHMPILFNIGFQSFAGLQLSAFASSGVLMSRHEREALAHHLLHTPSNSSTGVEAPSATLSEAEAANLSQILQLQTQGDALRPPLGLQSFTDRYFVEQIGPGILRERFCQRFVELMHIPGMPPLVVDLYTEMIGPFTLWCLFYHSHALQTATRKFVLTATEGDQSTSFSFFSQQMIDVKSKVNLTYLLEHPLLHRLLSVNGNLRHPKFKPLPIGFLYWHRSGQHLLATATEKEKKRELEDVEVHNEYMKLYLQGLNLTNSAVYSSDVQGVGDVHARQHRNEINFRGYLDLYTDLPVVVVNDTSDLTVENLEKWKRGVYEKFQRGEYNMEKLFMQYWMDEIYAP